MLEQAMRKIHESAKRLSRSRNGDPTINLSLTHIQKKQVWLAVLTWPSGHSLTHYDTESPERAIANVAQQLHAEIDSREREIANAANGGVFRG